MVSKRFLDTSQRLMRGQSVYLKLCLARVDTALSPNTALVRVDARATLLLVETL